MTGCQEDERLKMSPGSSKDGISEMILSFYNQIHPNSRSTNTLFSIKYISTETFKISDENKTRNASQNETYSIHTVLLDFEGTPGYAILSDTPGIEKIFYYTEEGCVGDTAAIAPLKEMIESFPIIAEDIMTGNYIDSQADNQNYPNIQPIVPFSWHQKKPFNNYAAYCACTYCSTDVMGNHRPMGCVTIALGQAIATVKKFTGKFYSN